MDQRYFLWMKQMLFNLNKSSVWIKSSPLNKWFSFIQSNLFSECTIIFILLSNNFIVNVNWRDFLWKKEIVPGVSVAAWGVNRFCEKSCVEPP